MAPLPEKAADVSWEPSTGGVGADVDRERGRAPIDAALLRAIRPRKDLGFEVVKVLSPWLLEALLDFVSAEIWVLGINRHATNSSKNRMHATVDEACVEKSFRSKKIWITFGRLEMS